MSRLDSDAPPALTMRIPNPISQRPQPFYYARTTAEYLFENAFRVLRRSKAQLLRDECIELRQILSADIPGGSIVFFVENVLADGFQQGSSCCNCTFGVSFHAREGFSPSAANTLRIKIV